MRPGRPTIVPGTGEGIVSPGAGSARIGVLGAVYFIAGLVLVAATAGLAAASLGLRRTADFLLAAYLVAAAEIVILCLALSPGEMLTRGWLLGGSALLLAAATLAWHARGHPRPPAVRTTLRAVKEVLRDPVVAVPAVAVSGALAYLGVLAVATPPNDYDTLWYHLSRAAFWAQQHAIGYVPQANDARLDVFPPGAEIVSAWAMVLGGNERFASLLQLVSLLAMMIAIAAIARRVGLGRREAVFGALLFASLPVVLLQASTALNDVALASFVVVAVCFFLSEARTGLVLGAVALALAVATKPTALIAPALLLVAVAALCPPRRWPAIAGAGVAGIVVGGFWYAFNRAERGTFIPQFAPSHDAPPPLAEHVRIPAQLARMAIDAVDPAGAVGRDRYLYVVAALVVLAIALLVARAQGSRGAATLGIVAGALVVVPIVFPTAHYRLLSAYQRLLGDADQEHLASLGAERNPVAPSSFVSWYGPLGLLAFIAGVALAVREVRRRQMRWGIVALAAAPAGYLLIVAFFLGYSEFHGRYVMPAVGLAAVTWGLLLRVRPLAWAAAVISVTTLVLAVVHDEEKSSGISILGNSERSSVWSMGRVEVLAGSKAPGGGGPTAVLERRARAGDVVVLLIRQDDVSYPFWGADLDRHIAFMNEDGTGLDEDADWLVEAPGLDAGVCKAGWEEVSTDEPGWQLYRRIGPCPGESASS